MNKYQQLTYEQRCQIEALKKSGFTQSQIGVMVDVSQSTISRELARNTGDRGYRHKQAQRRADSRRLSAAKAQKMTPAMISVIVDRLKEKWSPEQIAGWLLRKYGIEISHETIYLHIWQDKRKGGDLYHHLRRCGKAYEKRRNGYSSRGQIKNRVSIDQRPDDVDERSRVGDWEIDTVIGKGHSGALVTIVERKTQFTVSAQIPYKTAAAVASTTIELLSPYKDLVHTITADNGKEFSRHEVISQALECEFYFARPYHSWERGLNENTNGLLRQYWPKSTDFKRVANNEVDEVLIQLNLRPRKSLGFVAPYELMRNEVAAMAA